jgi:hypothetical protein
LNWLYCFIPVLIAVSIVLCVVWRRMVSPAVSLPATADWIEELSPERYRPMMHLLDPEDLEFLRSQPGFTPRMASRLRAQRCQIFQGYLRCLDQDFQKVAMAMKLILMYSSHDRPDLTSVLLRQQLKFSFTMVNVHARLFLYRWDFAPVDVTALVGIFDSMRLELQSLVPAAAGAAA